VKNSVSAFIATTFTDTGAASRTHLWTVRIETFIFAAILKAEELSPEAMERLLQIEPNWTDLCVVG
jgi:hypothetical protein